MPRPIADPIFPSSNITPPPFPSPPPFPLSTGSRSTLQYTVVFWSTTISGSRSAALLPNVERSRALYNGESCSDIMAQPQDLPRDIAAPRYARDISAHRRHRESAAAEEEERPARSRSEKNSRADAQLLSAQNNRYARCDLCNSLPGAGAGWQLARKLVSRGNLPTWSFARFYRVLGSLAPNSNMVQSWYFSHFEVFLTRTPFKLAFFLNVNSYSGKAWLRLRQALHFCR